MTTEKPERLFLKSRDWAELRAFLVRRKWLRDAIEADVYDAVCSGNTNDLSGKLLRELSVYVEGYLEAKGQH